MPESRRAVATALIAAAAIGLAQRARAQHAGHGAPAPTRADDPASTREFREANARVHRAMDIGFTGRAERDFVQGVIPHHEGAAEMARRVPRHGSDQEVRRRAEAAIREQEREIAERRAAIARLSSGLR